MFMNWNEKHDKMIRFSSEILNATTFLKLKVPGRNNIEKLSIFLKKILVPQRTQINGSCKKLFFFEPLRTLFHFCGNLKEPPAQWKNIP